MVPTLVFLGLTLLHTASIQQLLDHLASKHEVTLTNLANLIEQITALKTVTVEVRYNTQEAFTNQETQLSLFQGLVGKLTAELPKVKG